MKIRYALMNPTGNRTILVKTPADRKDYKRIAARLMKEEPTAEQVGFLGVSNDGVPKLEMAGGEFCGNATMSAAALLCLEGKKESPVRIRVSGAKSILKVDVDEKGRGIVKMPTPLEIREVKVTLAGKKTAFPAVIFEGITHIILSGTGIAKGKAEKLVKEWAGELDTPCLGLMFYDSGKNRIKPLVYVASPETLVWENSCGSGSVAVAAWLNHINISKEVYEFAEPGGRLSVIKKGKTFCLKGQAVLEKEGEITLNIRKQGKTEKTETVKPDAGREAKKADKAAQQSGKQKKPKAEKAKAEKTKAEKPVGKMSEKKRNERIRLVLAELDRQYGTDYKCYLNHENAWQLLFATIMSAQCTDERVNIVTKDLYVKYPTLEAFAKADLKELEQDIHSTGFYHNKAKNIIACAKELVGRYNGVVPSDLESLTALPGVGRKTANVIRGNIYHIDSIVVDTHVKRISNRLGFTTEEDPVKIEFDLMDKLPKDHWTLYNIHIIRLGRTICKAPTPKCEECFLKGYCPSCRTE